MKQIKLKGSYTIEAAIYIPIILFMLFQSLDVGIGFWQKSKDREVYHQLKEIDSVEDFYQYQILDEVRKEIEND